MYDDERRSKVVVTVYKQLGFYQLLDPRGPRARGRLVYDSALRIFLLAVQLIVAFGLVGFFVDREDAYTRSELFEIIVILVNCTLSSLKMYALLNNSDTIWELFEMTGVEFLRCTQRSKGEFLIKNTKNKKKSTKNMIFIYTKINLNIIQLRIILKVKWIFCNDEMKREFLGEFRVHIMIFI